MARALFYKTAVELDKMVERNASNRAELELILSELHHRDTLNAKGVERKARALLEQLGKKNVSDATKARVEKKRDLNARRALNLIDSFAERDWSDAAALEKHLERVLEYSGEQADALADRISARLREIEFVELAPTKMAEIVPPAEETTKMSSTTKQERRWTEEAVADLRKKLIDLSKRNPLIAFKHASRGASHLRFVDERPDIMFNRIVDGSMGFEPLPDEEVTPPDEQTATFGIAYERARLTDEEFSAATEKLGDDENDARAWQQAERQLRAKVRQQLGLSAINYGKTLDVKALAIAHGFDPSFDLKNSDEEDTQAHHQDDKLRVLLTRKELEKRLKTIWERYRGHARETGLHTLVLILGFVQWYEDDASDVALHAPLLLLPVQLERKVRYGRYEFRLSGIDEGLQVNIALAEKMRQFGLEVPTLRDGETPESFFIRVEGVLEKGRRLSLRKFATLAVLPFPRMVLWKDLDPANWEDGAFAEHPLLPVLLRAKGMEGPASMAETHDIDSPPWAEKAPPLIQPADASQHSALIDVVAGRSIAIEGPPGTGKSQTITNMIAAALAAGKTVLFVAEKQAALKVVADRLRHSGLGSLLLELHSDSADRSVIYNSLRERLSETGRVDQEALDTSRLQLAKQRDLIRRYLGLIRTKIGAMNRSAHWLAWREIGLRSRIERSAIDRLLRDWRPQNPKSIDRTALTEARERLGNFADALAAIEAASEKGSRTPWAEATRLGAFSQQTEISMAGEAAEAAARVYQASEQIASIIGIAFPAPGAAITAAVAQLDELVGFGALDENVARSALVNPDGARALLARQARWRQICSRLQEDLDDPAAVSDEAIKRLADALAAYKTVPATVPAFSLRYGAVVSAVRSAGDLEGDLSDLLEHLIAAESTPAGDLKEIAAALIELDSAPPQIKALFQSALLDELTMLAVTQEHDAATALAVERQSLMARVIEPAFDMTPDEIELRADTIENSGFFSRLFGGAYRSTRREVTRLLTGKFTDRSDVAAVLRRLARNIRQASAFRLESSASSLFPAPLWRGADSDWHSLVNAGTLLKSAAERLPRGSRAAAYNHWLGLSQRERGAIAGFARAVLPNLEAAADLGLNDVSACDLRDRLRSEEADLAAIDATFKEVAVKEDGFVVRDGESLPVRLEALRASATDFASLSTAPEFAWIDNIAGPLDALARALNHCDELAALSGPLRILDGLRKSATPVADLDAVVAKEDGYANAVANWNEVAARFEEKLGLAIDRLHAPGVGWDALSGSLEAMAADEKGAGLAADLIRYRGALAEIGCETLGTAAIRGDTTGAELPDLYELALVRTLLEQFLGGDGEELARLGSLTLESARASFVRIDKALQELEAKAIVAKRLKDRVPQGIDRGPKSGWTELSLLNSELSLRRPRTPIRDITARAGPTLQVLKPVWMMSPTSAAQYIQPGSLHFDLLVVDEASQMRPEFAVSAIMRGTQFVVVGDANQLPPTDFFSAAIDDDDGDSAEGSNGEKMRVDTESILDLANERFQFRRRLKWHYRSQHESLIQFSNRQFYGRDLIVFPSPTTEDELLGVKHHYVRSTYEASVNEGEAKAVVEEAFRLMRSYPQHSIGIATMNAKQTELIRNEFDRLILEAPEVRRYVDAFAGTIDEFFIKNLENVQGDERDIIIISTVYGPDKNGTVMQRFGPMNREVGWRRLNVLVTRAKMSTHVFTSLRPDDIKVTPTSSKGLIAFKSYLNYAENGAQYDDESGGEPDSDFEVFVADAIRDAGYEVIPQVGVEGFKIDLGVRHPDFPVGFIAGVECDGATYHSGMTVRDRDRIRQSVLEQMGWNIYRVWSTDWFADPARGTAKLLSQLDQWRTELAEDYARRPSTTAEEFDPAPEEDDPGVSEEAAEAVVRVEPEPKAAIDLETESDERTGPTGRPMRPLDDIEWCEVRKGYLYEVWLDGKLAGTVEVLSRATAAPHVYGGQLRVARSEYEGVVQATGDRFKVHDIHVAVREVARLAR